MHRGLSLLANVVIGSHRDGQCHDGNDESPPDVELKSSPQTKQASPCDWQGKEDAQEAGVDLLADPKFIPPAFFSGLSRPRAGHGFP
jgi:hypothetical protein